METNHIRHSARFLVGVAFLSGIAGLRADPPAVGATINYELPKWGAGNLPAHLEVKRVSEHVLLARPAITLGNSNVPGAGSLYFVGMAQFLSDRFVRAQVLEVIDLEVSAAGLPLLSISESPGGDEYIVCMGKRVVNASLPHPVSISPEGFKPPEKP